MSELVQPGARRPGTGGLLTRFAASLRGFRRRAPVAGAADDQGRALVRSFLFVSVVLPVVLFGVAAWYDYRQVTEGQRRRVLATTDALAEHAQKVIETNQLVMTLMRDRVKGMSWAAIHDDSGVHDYLARLTEWLPQLESAFLVEPGGTISASSRAFPMKPYDVADREYFRAAQAGNSGVFVSAPFRGQMAGTVAFTVSEPRDPDKPGEGLVAVTISPRYFQQFYAAATGDPQGTVAGLIRDDGTILVRSPGRSDMPSKLPWDSISLQALREGRAIYQGRSSVDGTFRLGAIRPLSGLPLAAAFSIARDAWLREWLMHVAVLAAFALLSACVLFLAARQALRHAAQERETLHQLIAETRRREAAEESLRQSQKIEALGRLTGGVAHDFNNLLTAVLGSLELASKRTQDSGILRLLNNAREAAQRGARLTGQMLAFARRQPVAVQTVRVDDVLRGIDGMLRGLIGPQIQLHYDLASGLWPVSVDPTQLEVAVMNLVTNARDAMPGGGALRVLATNLPAAEAIAADLGTTDTVVLTIADTGTGMTQDVLQRVFEPFFTTKEVGAGTGLGLSLVHGFARQSGGVATIESVPGQGTTVRIGLPRSAGRTAAPTETRPGTGGPALRVLLVDDDPSVREPIAEMLRVLGNTVTEAGDGEQAIRIVEAMLERSSGAPTGDTLPQLMVLDYAMPKMNGMAVAHALAALLPDVPLIFVTGFADSEALRDLSTRGWPVLNKPFTMEALAEAVQRTVRTAHAGAASPGD